MNVNQVYTIVNSISKQMFGEQAVTVTNLTGLIQLGDSVISSADNKDKFLDTLVDRIGKTIISQRAYSAEVANLMNDAFTFGAIMQKIYVAPIDASESKQWSLTSGTSVDQYVISKPTVKQKLFQDRDTWAITVTIPDFQLSSAFTSAEMMAAFIDAIFLAMRNSMEIYLEGMSEMCYANMIGCRIVHTKLNNGHTAIDMLAGYNALAGTSLTTAQAMVSLDFLKYATTLINLYVKKLGKMSTVYNSEGYARFTPKDRLRVTMLADFAAACDSYLQAPTYHNELVALPNYREVVYWQGSSTGTSMGFDATGKINIKTSDGYTVNQPYVVCMLSDEEAIGLTYDNRRSKSAYNSDGEYTNFFEKADMGYFNDLSENAIIFTVGALATPTLASVTPLNRTYDLNAAGTNHVAAVYTITPGTETFASVKVNGTALTVTTDYTYATGTLTILTTYLAGLTAGTRTAFTIGFSSGAELEVYVDTVDTTA